MTKDELISRWGKFSTVNLPDSPFGITEEGHSDFRGFSFLRRSEIKAFKLENCDFSYADFTERWIQGTAFTHCVFDRAVMDGIKDHCNRFTHCSFKNASFRRAALGYKATRYANCRFEGCNFTGCLFSNAIFRQTEFVNNKIKTIDFNVSGFWDCSFAGEVNDVTFRGRYAHKSDRQFDPFPQEIGLHNVDFGDAFLSYIWIKDKCPVEGLRMPQDGSAFLCDSKTFAEAIPQALTAHLGPDQRASVESYLVATTPSGPDEGPMVITRSEMVGLCRDEVLGSKLYSDLKGRCAE